MKKIILGLMVFLFTLPAQEIYTNFNVTAEQSANLAFDASGVVKKVYVDVASSVKKGEKLAELNNDDLKASLQIAKASLDKAEVSVKFAQRDYERQLKIRHLIDEAKFDTYLFAYEKAKVELDQAKANLAYQQSMLDKTTLYAPFDGVIFDKSLEVGDVVSGMMLRTVFKIQSLSKRKLILEFDQKYWKEVKVGQTFKYSVEGDEKVREGIISERYPSADQTNRKLKAEVKADGLLVGLFGEGYIIVPDKK